MTDYIGNQADSPTVYNGRLPVDEKEHQEIKTKGENIETRDGSKK
jgi:hypothetical protein